MPVDVTTVDFLMTDSAIAKSWRSQIVKRWRYNPDDGRYAGGLLREVCMTLETDEADLGPCQHLRIS